MSMKTRLSITKNMTNKKDFEELDFSDENDEDFRSEEENSSINSENNQSDITKNLRSSNKNKIEQQNLIKLRKRRISPILLSKSPFNIEETSKKLKTTENSLMKEDFNISMKCNDNEDPFFQLEVQRLIASPASYCLQPVCNVCETYNNNDGSDNSSVIRCTGVCLRYYHKDCVEYPPGQTLSEGAIFQCPDCWTKTYYCILCKTTDKITSLLHCENNDCGRLYHKVCLDKSNFHAVGVTEDSIKSCPAHHCVSCVREDRSCIEKPEKKLFQCLRCPASFHDAELCMAAGSIELSLSQVICPLHFEDKLIKMNSYKPFHPDWCFKCFKYGAKLLCQHCPSSFHFDCVYNNHSKKPLDAHRDNIYVCHDCRNHRQPRYGEIVFVKASQYRWWPCEIIHPRNAPMNILRLTRPEGTFPILFLGSQEYHWAARSRTIYYNIASLSPIIKDSGGNNKMDKEFTMGLEQAAKMHKIFVNILLNYIPLRSIKAETMLKSEIAPFIDFKENDKKTMKYTLIKVNVVVPPAKFPSKKIQSICDCKDSCEVMVCRNFVNRVQCDREVCAMKDNCHNQLFGDCKQGNKNLGVNKTLNRGFGLKTTELLKENEFIIEYLGEVITRAASVNRVNQAKKNNIKDFYMMRLSGDLIVDAGPKGNLSRFINHSCNPNCRVERWTVGGYIRLGIFANRDISPGEELTYDYRLSGFILREDIFCLCNSINCSGFLGPERLSNISPVKTTPVVKGSILSILEQNTKKSMKDEELIAKPVDIVDESKKMEIIEILESPKKKPPFIEPINKIKKLDESANKTESNCFADFSKKIRNEVPRRANSMISGKNLQDNTVTKSMSFNDFIKKCNPNQKNDIKESSKKSNISEESIIKQRMPENYSVKKRKLETAQSKESEERIKNRVKEILERCYQEEASNKFDFGKTNRRKTYKDEGVTKTNDSTKESLNKTRLVKDSEGPQNNKELLKKSEYNDIAKKINPIEKSPLQMLIINTPGMKTDDIVKEILRNCLPKKNNSNQIELNNECMTKIKNTNDHTKEIYFINTAGKQFDKSLLGNCCAIPKKSDQTGQITATQKTSGMSFEDSLNWVSNSEESRKKTRTSKEVSNRIEPIKIMMKGSEPIKILPKKTQEENQSSKKINIESDMIIENVKKRDPIKERLMATEAIIEKVSKKFVIKGCGQSPEHDSPTKNGNISPKKSVKTVKKEVVYEIVCFRCFDGGELLLCDKEGCIKTYHLSCLGLEKAPVGTWYCPWHFCNTCGSPSHLFCSHCPDSFCKAHSNPTNIKPPSDESRLSLCHFHSQWSEGNKVTDIVVTTRSEEIKNGN